MEEEVWKPIKDYEGLYEVSNLGRVKSLNYRGTGKGKILKNIEDSKGYLTVCLTKNGRHKMLKVHRLVAETFIPNPEGKPCIDHINTIKNDNRIENLRWATNEENSNNPLTKKKMSENHANIKGENHPFYGKQHTEETKKKMSENHSDFSGSKNPQANMVICIYPDGTQIEPMRIKELAKYLGLDRGTVRRVINNSEIYHPKYKRYKHLEGIKIIKIER